MPLSIWRVLELKSWRYRRKTHVVRTSTESAYILELLGRNSRIIHGVNFNYRMNPLVQEMKYKVANGEISVPRLIYISYLQDWLLYNTDYNWRLKPEINRTIKAVANIDSHWMDTAQVVTGTKITEVYADLVTALSVRGRNQGLRLKPSQSILIGTMKKKLSGPNAI